MADNTVFDSVFKTIAHRAPKLLIPLVNEAFGRDYPYDEPVVQFSAEHEGLQGTIIADTVFRLHDKIYHVECQSTPDSGMAVRMIEYDFAIALAGAIGSGEPYEMDFPESCVLYLRHTSSTPDALEVKVNLPTGDSFTYEAKVVKAQLITSDELFEKNLLLLLPFYLMRYERALSQIEADDAKSAQLLAECADLRARLEDATLVAGDPLLYEQLTELIIRVSDHMLASYDALRRKVRRTMGGEVLELMRDRAARLEREAREQGIEQGIKRGIEQGIGTLLDELRARGVAEDVIASAEAAARARFEEDETPGIQR